jgi:phage/plasmid-like protein (TIGR03299 family)
MAWLNANVLIGHTDKRGKAWHYRASAQGAEPNHYPGPIPVADVQRRLFNWRVESGPVLVQAGRHGLVRANNRQAIYADDTGDVLGVFADGYGIHQYPDWLLDKVESILDGGLSIGSAGLLRNRTQAWVSVEVPDTVRTPEGVQFRPNLLACTSHDGSLATTYKRVVTNVVCDNTMSAGLTESGQVIKIKHSRNSTLKVLDARKALEMVMTVADDFAAEVQQLCRVTVTDAQWRQFLSAHVSDGDSKRSQTRASNERAELNRLWDYDERVSPWRNTAWAVVQAVNTYTHHYGTVRGASRVERNLCRVVDGHTDSLDLSTITMLDKVLAAA